MNIDYLAKQQNEKKKPLHLLKEKIDKLEIEVVNLKNIILDLHLEVKNLKMSTVPTDCFLVSEINKDKKKKGWLWDY